MLGRAGLCCVLALAGACAALGAELEADGDRTPVALDPQEKLARGLSHAQEPLSLADAPPMQRLYRDAFGETGGG